MLDTRFSGNDEVKAAWALCRSGKFDDGEGRCAGICHDQVGHKPARCPHATTVFGKLVKSILKELS